jgi:Protein of unknown function (DUF2867)
MHRAQGRLPNSAHTSHPWRIHEIVPDFRLEDVWELPAQGQKDDFEALVQGFAGGDPAQGPWLARVLWETRWKLGALLGWDRGETGIGGRVQTLRERLPEDLRHAQGPIFETLPFTSLYLTEDEFAAEIANHTMHGVMHLSFLTDGAGVYRCHMAVLVKPNGMLGSTYMAAIRPFRHLIVYPAMMKQVEREAMMRSSQARSSRTDR